MRACRILTLTPLVGLLPVADETELALRRKHRLLRSSGTSGVAQLFLRQARGQLCGSEMERGTEAEFSAARQALEEPTALPPSASERAMSPERLEETGGPQIKGASDVIPFGSSRVPCAGARSESFRPGTKERDLPPCLSAEVSEAA